MTTKLEVEKGQVRDLERRLAEAVKVLPFVPAGPVPVAVAVEVTVSWTAANSAASHRPLAARRGTVLRHR